MPLEDDGVCVFLLVVRYPTRRARRPKVRVEVSAAACERSVYEGRIGVRRARVLAMRPRVSKVVSCWGT